MGQIFEAVKQFFRDEGWDFLETEVGSGLLLDYAGKNGQWRCFARVREPERQFIFYSYAPVNIELDQRMAIAEFITRANFGAYIGNFELSFVTGNLQYRTSIDVEGLEDPIIPGILNPLIDLNVAMMDRYLPGVLAVLEGEMTPEEAVAAIENE